MGLDQYLHAKRYTSTSQAFSPDLYKEIIRLLDADKFAEKSWGGATAEICVGYWRKANHIHRWFVDNCQGGVDDCRDAYVSREQLRELRGLCEQVLSDKSRAEELLPTQSGFFFGGTEYDDYYFSDIENTIEIIDRVLGNVPEGFEWHLSYSSSW